MKKSNEIKRALVVLSKTPSNGSVFNALTVLQKEFSLDLKFLVVLHKKLTELLELDLKRVIDRTREHLEGLVPKGSTVEIEVGDFLERVLVMLKAENIDFLVFVGQALSDHIKIIRTAMVPTLFLHDEREFPGTRIGVPLELGSSDSYALEWAKTFKEKLQTEVITLRFFTIPGIDYIKALNLTDSIDKIDNEFEKMQSEEVGKFLSEVGYKDVIDKVIIEQDAPKAGILKSVEKHEIGTLIMTIKQSSLIEQLFLGTITESVLHHLPTHVLTIPVGGEKG